MERQLQAVRNQRRQRCARHAHGLDEYVIEHQIQQR